MASKIMGFDVVRDIALALPGVQESTIHGAPSWKAGGKLLACPAIHASAEPNTLAVRVDFAQRDELVAKQPNVYYLTDHYQGHATVLVRLSKIDRKALQDLLHMAWQFVTPKAKKKAGQRRTWNKNRP